MRIQPWPSEWLRGLLSLAVMRLLADGPSYGYEIATRLGEAGFGDVKGGTLYPLLSRLETAGSVLTEWRAGDGGPGRKYFELTDPGRAELAAQVERWAQFARTTTAFLTEEIPHDHHH